MFLFVLLFWLNHVLLRGYHVVKLHSHPQLQSVFKAFMVDGAHLIVNGIQFLVNGCFVKFQGNYHLKFRQ